MSRPEILVVTIHAGRMPGSGGNVRAHFFIRTACQLGNVTLVSLCGALGQQVSEMLTPLCRTVVRQVSEPPGEVDGKRRGRLTLWLTALTTLLCPCRRQWRDFISYCVQYCSEDTSAPKTARVSIGKRVLKGVLQCEYAVLSRMGLLPPLSCAAYWNEFQRMRPIVERLTAERTYDFVWVEDVFAWPFAEILMNHIRGNKPEMICNTYNIETSVFERMADSAEHETAQRYWKTQSRFIERMESRAYERSVLTFVCSERDRELGQALAPHGNFQVVGNGVDLSYFRPDPLLKRSERPTILFTGTFGYGPNRDALQFFVRDMLPLIHAAKPDVRFVFAGGQAQQAWDDLNLTNPAVECVSDPDDIRPCFSDAWVFVVPLLAGGGTRLKILEAMAMGVPIVSTIVGAEGLECVDGQHILLADQGDPEVFAGHVLRLLRDELLRTRMADRSAEWVRRNYDWQELCAKCRRVAMDGPFSSRPSVVAGSL